MSDRYEFAAIEAKWRAHWDAHGTYRTLGPGDAGFNPALPKYYVLDMFPYPSGKGLHVGHPLGYIATDIVARFKRMRGFNVLHPMGFDAFGLPAEQYAVEHNVHPRITTEENIATMTEQLRSLSLGYDWERSISTIDPKYYRWTQWIFLQLYHSWFDPRVGAARPVAQLEAALERGELVVDAGGAVVASGDVGAMGTRDAAGDIGATRAVDVAARPWSSLGAPERRAVLDGQRLAYLAEVPVNWCPRLGTVLANEEVTADGRSERGNFPVYRRPLEQWMLRITAYADRLLDDLDGVEWPEAIKIMQRNWIGRSEGARVAFPLAEGGGAIEVFTTRPDTLFGATYMVLAPEHPLVDAVTTDAQRAAVGAYRAEAGRRTDVDRQAESREKTGVFTGGYATNPASGERIPIWIADYVLSGYGTGAIMAVPAHDQRDLEFARRFELPVRAVVMPPDGWLRAHAPAAADGLVDGNDGVAGDVAALRSAYAANPTAFGVAYVGEGMGIASTGDGASLDGLPTTAAKATIIAWLAARGHGSAKVQFKLRDWLFSRQRYWGEPFPILHGPDGEIRAVPEADLPVLLPPMDDFHPEGTDDPDAPPRPPLARAPEAWRTVELDGVRYQRELNTMPNWAGSCWYYLRYLDPDNDQRLVDPERERYWMGQQGVDLYVGGVEHAVLHLLYARFWHKVLFDLGHVGTPEPFARLVNQGYIQAHAYADARGVYVPADAVEERGGAFYHQGRPVTRAFGKMGKSLKNMVTPEGVIGEFGGDALRLYEMYMGPLDQSKPWSTRDIVGISRFLARVWRNLVDEDTGALLVDQGAAEPELARLLHATIARVTESMETLRFNTAISSLIQLNNALVERPTVPREVAEGLVAMLAPMAPHIAEELWERLGHAPSVTTVRWPAFDPAMLVADEVEIVLQVNGKVRGRIMVPAGADRASIEAIALADASVQRHLNGQAVRNVVVVPGRLVNVVAG